MARTKSKSTQVAAAISVHLKRFEADPKINTRIGGTRELYRFYRASAYASGGWVRVIYISYQGPRTLRIAEAEQYLKWLDEGNVGQHFESQAQARGAAALKAFFEDGALSRQGFQELVWGRDAEQIRRGAEWLRAWAAQEPEPRARQLDAVAEAYESLVLRKKAVEGDE